VGVALFEFRSSESASSPQLSETRASHSQFITQLEQPLERLIRVPGVANSAAYTVKKMREITSTTAAQLYLAKHSGYDQPVVIKVAKLFRLERRPGGSVSFWRIATCSM